MPPDLGGPEQPVHQVEDRRVPGDGGLIPVRVYRPSATPSLPALIYFHGGGFVLGGLDMSDRPCRALANDSGCVVISVDYRLAPEHPFPAAADDAFAATAFVASRAADFGVDPARIAVGGESAGGNLAAVVALRARDSGGPSLAFQLLVYPLVDFTDESPSMREFASGHFLTTEDMDYFADHYLPRPIDRRQAWASPLHANLKQAAAGIRADGGMRPAARSGRSVRAAPAGGRRAHRAEALRRHVPPVLQPRRDHRRREDGDRRRGGGAQERCARS